MHQDELQPLFGGCGAGGLAVAGEAGEEAVVVASDPQRDEGGVRGHGGETEAVETYRGMTVKVELHDKVRLEIGVSDPFVEPTVRAILSAGKTGEVGDGKIFVLPVEKVYRIRTGEEDRSAVTPVTSEESGV